MRLRRLEIIIIAITLAFAFFLGGFFTGRNWNTVNITAVTTQKDETPEARVVAHPPEATVLENQETHIQPPISTDTPVTTIAPEPDPPAEPVGVPRAGDGRININLATQSELTDLPGIGNVLASRIVDYRRQNGDFQRIEDIRNVSGIGEKRYEAIQDKITIGH